MADLLARVVATEPVIAAFRDRPFDWNGATCAHLAWAQMLAMGHVPPALPAFRSKLGAVKALRSLGHATMAEALDAVLPRIAPAAMLVGDLALVEGEAPFDAVLISAGGKLVGYHQDHLDQGVVNMEVDRFIGAWRL